MHDIGNLIGKIARPPLPSCDENYGAIRAIVTGSRAIALHPLCEIGVFFHAISADISDT